MAPPLRGPLRRREALLVLHGGKLRWCETDAFLPHVDMVCPMNWLDLYLGVVIWLFKWLYKWLYQWLYKWL